jgi:gluconate kinase
VHDREDLKHRVLARSEAENHYMKSSMVDSQLDLMEDPADEPDVLVLDSTQPKAKLIEDVVEIVKGILRS